MKLSVLLFAIMATLTSIISGPQKSCDCIVTERYYYKGKLIRTVRGIRNQSATYGTTTTSIDGKKLITFDSTFFQATEKHLIVLQK